TPGQTLLTGQVSFNDYRNYLYLAPPDGFQKNVNLNTSLSISKFKNPLLLSGFGFSYSYSYSQIKSNATPSEQKSNQNSFHFFYTRSKLKSLAKNLYLSISGNAGITYSHNRSRVDNGSTGYDGNALGGEVYAGLGMVYKMDKHFLANLSLSNLLNLSYLGGHLDTFNPADQYRIISHTFQFQTGFTNFSLSNIVFGISYLIP
ncbi:MAG: hypothetical protein KGO92_02835, partial [Bacteroidota bacterium]|nr:hypothetical protein [Bacteroidota bacterium]